jgi:hypothetical protein
LTARRDVSGLTGYGLSQPTHAATAPYATSVATPTRSITDAGAVILLVVSLPERWHLGGKAIGSLTGAVLRPRRRPPVRPSRGRVLISAREGGQQRRAASVRFARDRHRLPTQCPLDLLDLSGELCR